METAITAEQVSVLLGVAPSKNIPLFLSLIAFSEGANYNTIVTGIHGPEVFTDYSTHPFANGRPPQVVRLNPLLESTASGRYQLLERYWVAYKKQLNLPDFSPLSQDKIAIQQIGEHRDANHVGALTHIINGDIQTAIQLCSATWASFPNNSYGQGGKSMGTLLTKWAELVAA